MKILTDAPGFLKDTESNAILRNDVDALTAHRLVKRQADSRQAEINTLKTEISEIKAEILEIKKFINY
jgi:peptidoglycan hydrolase CwlO-like protein|tara:strand:+ start:147 stop:350 length:204 start_codon:yes stop_codon:yes gene_type:complete